MYLQVLDTVGESIHCGKKKLSNKIYGHLVMALLQCYCDNSKLVKCCWLDQLGLIQIKLMAHVCHILSLPNIKPSLNIKLQVMEVSCFSLYKRKCGF